MPQSFYWHDYETWGADPSRDRAAQFAGLRTDADLNPIGDPLVIYSRPADDMLPHPEACLVTGITPQQALQKGLPEAEFIDRIHTELARPGTCGVGYNSIRFDDEVTRYTLYRNFFDPYAREWRNGNSRWDLIDVMRMAHALRPEGINWPSGEDGVVSFRLEKLTKANGIGHEAAHDALSDVHATIALARLLKRAQPKLYDYALGLMDKRQAEATLKPDEPAPLLHVSSKYPAKMGCIAPIMPLARHPVNRNGIIVADLRADPGLWMALSPEQIREGLYTRQEDLAPGQLRPPLKTVHLNRSPMLAPMKTLSAAAAGRWHIEPAKVAEHARQILAAPGLQAKILSVYSETEGFPARDPDQDLYGGFLSDQDRRLGEQVRQTPPDQLGAESFDFRDSRLPVLLFRYRARNWPQSLAPEERALWDIYRRKRLKDPQQSGISLTAFNARIEQLLLEHQGDEGKQAVLRQLAGWPAEIGLA